jgi:hypothetical protein
MHQPRLNLSFFSPSFGHAPCASERHISQGHGHAARLSAERATRLCLFYSGCSSLTIRAATVAVFELTKAKTNVAFQLGAKTTLTIGLAH